MSKVVKCIGTTTILIITHTKWDTSILEGNQMVLAGHVTFVQQLIL